MSGATDATGATGAGGTEAFAGLLRELKDRSGLSYGTLAKRLHMSTSTLHRYCNGTAVPVDYAPVERLARVCRATPEELVELHRRWILADATRGLKAEPVPPVEVSPAQTQVGPVGPVPPPDRPRRARRRTVLIASAAMTAVLVLGAVALAASPPFGGSGDGNGDADGTGGRRAADTGARFTEAAGAGKRSATPSASPTGHRPSTSASPGNSPSKTEGGEEEEGPGSAVSADAVPLTVGTRPYVYDQPCSQTFLVNNEPEQMGPPASEQDAPRWAAAYGAVSSGEQEVGLTIQGTGEDTVVLESLHVRVLTRDAPLAWNTYAMGDGCGGGVETKAFDVALDSGSPTVTVKGGQRDFPYKVSESDPEVFYVTAHTTAYDIRWDLTLNWSSGGRRGTVHIDNDGTPFRTSADANRPHYVYPLGGNEWIKDPNEN